jgi:hypothetical protein
MYSSSGTDESSGDDDDYLSFNKEIKPQIIETNNETNKFKPVNNVIKSGK